MDKKGRGVSQFSVSVFVSQYGTIRRGTRNPSVLCFRNFLVAKISGIRRGREHHNFPSKLFCLTVPKQFVGETFCAVFQKKSGGEKL